MPKNQNVEATFLPDIATLNRAQLVANATENGWPEDTINKLADIVFDERHTWPNDKKSRDVYHRKTALEAAYYPIAFHLFEFSQTFSFNSLTSKQKDFFNLLNTAVEKLIASRQHKLSNADLATWLYNQLDQLKSCLQLQSEVDSTYHDNTSLALAQIAHHCYYDMMRYPVSRIQIPQKTAKFLMSKALAEPAKRLKRQIDVSVPTPSTNDTPLEPEPARNASVEQFVASTSIETSSYEYLIAQIEDANKTLSDLLTQIQRVLEEEKHATPVIPTPPEDPEPAPPEENNPEKPLLDKVKKVFTSVATLFAPSDSPKVKRAQSQDENAFRDRVSLRSRRAVSLPEEHPYFKAVPERPDEETATASTAVTPTAPPVIETLESLKKNIEGKIKANNEALKGLKVEKLDAVKLDELTTSVNQYTRTRWDWYMKKRSKRYGEIKQKADELKKALKKYQDTPTTDAADEVARLTEELKGLELPNGIITGTLYSPTKKRVKTDATLADNLPFFKPKATSVTKVTDPDKAIENIQKLSPSNRH